jgi:uncharacterized membrane protein
MHEHALNDEDIHAIPWHARRTTPLNVGARERWASAIFGAALLATGLKRKGLLGFAAGAAGTYLATRAVRGHCPAYAAIGVSTRNVQGLGPQLMSGRTEEFFRVERSITIARPATEVYQFLRDPTHIPHFAAHIANVENLGEGRFLAIPRNGSAKPWEMLVEYDEEGRGIVLHHSEEPLERLTIMLADAPGGRGTELRVAFDIERQRKALRRALTIMSGDDPDTLLRADLRRLKMLLEAGEVVTVEGQSMGQGVTNTTAAA